MQNSGVSPSLNTQSYIRRPFKFEKKILAYFKAKKSKKINWRKKNHKNSMMQHFSADAIECKIFWKKIVMKKRPQKLPMIHNWFFFTTVAWLPQRPKNKNLVLPKAPWCRTGYLDWGVSIICKRKSWLEISRTISRTQTKKNAMSLRNAG